MDALTLRKNLLDLEYTTALQYYTTTIVLTFTYFIGVLLAYFSQDVSLTLHRMFLFLIVSECVLIVCGLCLLSFSYSNEIDMRRDSSASFLKN